MPIYEFKCPDCQTVFERVYSLADYAKKPQHGCPECRGFRAKRYFSKGNAIQCDSINDVKWLPSALLTLQRDGERPITSRTEWREYCKKEQVVCKG